MKKLLALCLTVMLVLAMVPVIGAAAADAAIFAVNSVEGAAGDEVTVTVSIDANPGLTYAQIKVSYDATALEVVNIEKLTFAGKETSCSPTTVNPLKVTFADGLADTTATGDLAKITFKIKADAAAGTYALAVSAEQENVYDVKFNDIPFETKDGAIKVVCKHAATEVVDAKDATCTEAGYTGDKVCTACGEKVEAGKAIDALGHKAGDPEGAVAPDCGKQRDNEDKRRKTHFHCFA